MKTVFKLYYYHEFSDGREESQLIGIYSTKKLAVKAKKRAKAIPKFSKYPKAIQINKTVIGRVGWTEGYSTYIPSDLTE